MKTSVQAGYVYDSHHDAEEAIGSLGKAGFYSTGHRIKVWGAISIASLTILNCDKQLLIHSRHLYKW
jgi:hypothetical protein